MAVTYDVAEGRVMVANLLSRLVVAERRVRRQEGRQQALDLHDLTAHEAHVG